jgi:hypothetical protein
VSESSQRPCSRLAGLVVPPENPEALAEAMLAMDAGGAQRYDQAALAAAHEFDLRESARELVGALQRAQRTGATQIVAAGLQPAPMVCG